MNQNYEQILNEWKVRLTKAQVGHYKESESYLKMHKYIGFPLVIISSVITGFLFLKPSSETVQWLMALASIISTVLATLQIFIRPSEQAEYHRQFATQYGALRREVEAFLSVGEDDEFQGFREQLISKWDNVAKYAPVTSSKVRGEIKKILLDEKIDVLNLK